MPISGRLPPQIKKKLADNCMTNKVTRGEEVKRALERLLEDSPARWGQYPVVRKFIGSDPTPGDLARHTKRLLRERPLVKPRRTRP